MNSFQELLNDPSLQLNGTDFARVRLFDLLIGDWSKHEDNWKWAGFERGDQYRFIRLPLLFPLVNDYG